jgi:DNA-binding transcriptional LysR family regulator
MLQAKIDRVKLYLVTVIIAFYVYIALDVGNRREIVSRLSRNEDDLCIMGMPPSGMQIQRHPFVENPIVAVARKNHLLAGKKHISLARLSLHALIGGSWCC